MLFAQKTFAKKDICPEKHLPQRYLPRRSFAQKAVCPEGQLPRQQTSSRQMSSRQMSSGQMLFMANVSGQMTLGKRCMCKRRITLFVNILLSFVSDYICAHHSPNGCDYKSVCSFCRCRSGIPITHCQCEDHICVQITRTE
jgi:hypothetical protein